MKKILNTLIIFFVFSNFLFAYANSNVTEYYPEQLLKSIEKLKYDFNEQNLENIYKEFIIHKGIRDVVIASALTDIALNNKDKLNDYYIGLIKRFDVDYEDKIEAVLSSSLMKKFSILPEYINNFAIYTIFKYVSTFFILLMLLYLFIKNKFIFFHFHTNLSKPRKILTLVVFIFLTFSIGSFIPNYIVPILAFSSIILTVPEKNANKMILFVFIFSAVIFNQVDYKAPEIKQKLISDLVNNPVSKAFFEKISKDNFSYKIIEKIKYPDTELKIQNADLALKSREDRINLSIYYLMNNDFDKFKKLLPSNLLEDSLILLNLASYYFSTFQYNELEKINKRLYQYPFLYKISDDYHQFTGKPLFLPYSDEIDIDINDGRIVFGSTLYISLLLALIGLLGSFLISRKFEFFKCTSCGDIFCIECDDGFERNQVCDACKNIYNVKHNAEASILVKKRITIENYQYNLKRFSKVLSMFLPGAGHIYLNKHIFGSFLTLFFSLIIFMGIFGFEPFVSYDNIAVHIIFYPFYIFLLSIFVVFYIISIFYRK